MQSKTPEKEVYLRHLGDGLVLRRATPEDAEALADFNARIHSDVGPHQPDERVRAWVLDLVARPHPTCTVGDFTIVEEQRSGKIVSSMNLISQNWSYGGVHFGVGRPELVGTLPEFRNRGLVRAQFDVIHRWSSERNEVVQAIEGIPYYYRLFGYEMAMNLRGGRLGYRPQVPQLKEGEREPFQLRPALEDDLHFIADLVARSNQRYLVSCVRDEALWRYELSGKSPSNVDRVECRIIQDGAGQRIGFLAHSPFNWRSRLAALVYELQPGVSWGMVSPSVIRYLYTTGESYAAQEGNQAEFNSFGFWLGADHPAYQAMHDTLPQQVKPYALYLRVPDLPGFLKLVTPFLEQRLAASPYAGHSGILEITTYGSGLRLVLEGGRLSNVGPWTPSPNAHSGDAAFPGLTFLQLLFGYRSLEELDYAFADCWWDGDTAYGLLNALFPKQVSDIWAVT